MDDKRYDVHKSDSQWQEELSPEEFAVLRRSGTERPGTGKLLGEHRVGIYSCRACGNELFTSETKFESHCGWPSFFEAARSEAVERIERSQPRNAAHRGALQEVRLAPRPRVRRRAADADGRALLHELGGADFRAEVAQPARAERPMSSPMRSSARSITGADGPNEKRT